MISAVLKGQILRRKGLDEGYVFLENGSIKEVGAGPPPSLNAPEIEGLIIPGFMNMHTHLGDCGARGILPGDLSSAVHPGGVKHRFLTESPLDALVSSYRHGLSEALCGSSIVMDFREGGTNGIRIAKKAAKDIEEGRLLLMGRPEGTDDIDALLGSSDGLGIPAVGSADPAHRKIARDAGKPYSIHASELYREDIEGILDLDPDLLVHMISADEDDWRETSRRNIPVCICPRANTAFGLHVPLKEMLGAGLRLVLGTDNSMAVRQDMFREMENAYFKLRDSGPSSADIAEQVFSMAVGETISGTALEGMIVNWTPWWIDGWPVVGDRAHFNVLKVPDDPYWMEYPIEHVVRFSSQKDILLSI